MLEQVLAALKSLQIPPELKWLLIAAIGCLLPLVFGVVAPNQDFSPVMRRWAEIGEYILVALIVPLLLWLLDLYRMVREI